MATAMAAMGAKSSLGMSDRVVTGPEAGSEAVTDSGSGCFLACSQGSFVRSTIAKMISPSVRNTRIIPTMVI
jgi:hypothetical protein